VKYRYRTIESYFIGSHQFKIQERSLPAYPECPEKYTRQEFRVYHRWFGRTHKVKAHFIAEELLSESGCRLEILRYLQLWHALGSTKMFARDWRGR
jgi:hypothetical protein